MGSIKEIKGNIFDVFLDGNWDAVCVTTNGIIKRNGQAVMGAGVALACVKNYPSSSKSLGDKLIENGNIVQVIIETNRGPILSFPTKDHWKDKSDMKLIKSSCSQLMDFVDERKLKNVLLPRPGCSNGGLIWENVKKEIETLLDDRVTIISMEQPIRKLNWERGLNDD